MQLTRDESANLAWGIERSVPGVSGDPYDAHGRGLRPRGRRVGTSTRRVGSALVYRLASPVPDHWIPFAPVSVDPRCGSDQPGDPAGAPRDPARRAPTAVRRPVHPKGLLLRSDPNRPPDAEPPLRIEEEEVPREGALVERGFQYARWFDGAGLLWLGRRKTVGRGEASSGLRFDVLDRPTG